MSYPEIKVPDHIVQDTIRMGLADVQNYFNWFMSIKDERLKLFYQQVFGSQKVELSLNKLQAIYYYFRNNVVVKSRSLEEIEEERVKLPKQLRRVHKVPDYEIIEPTFSMIVDAGIYFGELLRNEVPGVYWTTEKNKRMAHYGKPILVKKDVRTDADPASVFYTMVLKIQKGTINEDMLTNAYGTIRDSFQGKSKDYLELVERWSKGKP